MIHTMIVPQSSNNGISGKTAPNIKTSRPMLAISKRNASIRHRNSWILDLRIVGITYHTNTLFAGLLAKKWLVSGVKSLLWVQRGILE